MRITTDDYWSTWTCFKGGGGGGGGFFHHSLEQAQAYRPHVHVCVFHSHGYV